MILRYLFNGLGKKKVKEQNEQNDGFADKSEESLKKAMEFYEGSNMCKLNNTSSLNSKRNRNIL